MTNPNDTSGYAFPQLVKETPYGPGVVSGEQIATGGLTKREWFAGLAMQMMDLPHDGKYAELNHVANGRAQKDVEWRASVAVRMADALIAELKK